MVTVDDGTGEHIVCAGVRNFAAGDLVPWAKPGSRVPTLPEPLAPRKLRGVLSNGMLCSPHELNLADSHAGILLLTHEDLSVGDDFKAVVGLDDAVLDIEIEPNRPDLMSVLGVAREVAAATGAPLAPPDVTVRRAWRPRPARPRRGAGPERCPRYLARVILGVGSGLLPPVRRRGCSPPACAPSRRGRCHELRDARVRPAAAPFDLDRRGRGHRGPARPRGRADGHARRRRRALTAEDLVIAIMQTRRHRRGHGGADAEVASDTQDMLLESAYFTLGGSSAPPGGSSCPRRRRSVSNGEPTRAAGTRRDQRGAVSSPEWAGGGSCGGAVAWELPPGAPRSRCAPRASGLPSRVTARRLRGVFDRLGMAPRSPATPSTSRSPATGSTSTARWT